MGRMRQTGLWGGVGEDVRGWALVDGMDWMGWTGLGWVNRLAVY